MRDDFAAGGGVSALSSGEDIATVETPYASSAFAGADDPSPEDDLDISTEVAPAAGATETAPAAPAQSYPSAYSLHYGVTVYVCRGAGDCDHVDALVEALRGSGWEVELSAPPIAHAQPGERIEPGSHAGGDARLRVALGLGLGGSRAMWQGWDARLGHVDGVVAVCPFLGFDSPIFHHSAKGVGVIKRRAFKLAGKSGWRPVSSRVECVSAYTGLGRFVSEPISWADLVFCAPGVEFAGLMSHVSCPTAIILDSEDPDLDAERAQAQIQAMSALVSVEIRPLEGEYLLHAVEHALFCVIRYHQEGAHTGAPVTDPSNGTHPL